VALFNETTAKSNCEEIAAFFRMREILSGCTGLQTLLEAADASTAKSLIVTGPTEPPFNQEAYTVGELENRIAWAQLFPKLDQDSFMVTWSKGVGATPEKEGFFRLHVRRQVRQAEYQAIGGRADAWLYFFYLTSWMCEQYVEATDLNLRSEQIKRVQGPMYNVVHQANWPEFGYFVYADFLIPWGGSESGE
jgi:hypothetical protein